MSLDFQKPRKILVIRAIDHFLGLVEMIVNIEAAGKWFGIRPVCLDVIHMLFTVFAGPPADK